MTWKMGSWKVPPPVPLFVPASGCGNLIALASPVASARLRGFGLRASVYELRVTSFGLRASDDELRVTGFGLWTSSYGLRGRAKGGREEERKRARGEERRGKRSSSEVRGFLPLPGLPRSCGRASSRSAISNSAMTVSLRQGLAESCSACPKALP